MAPELHPPRTIAHYGISNWRAIAGDASGRRYWRVGLTDGRSAVLCLYPETMRSMIDRDLEVLVWLRRHGISVPQVWVGDSSSPWVMLEDLGHRDGEEDLRSLPTASRVDRVIDFLGPLIQLSGMSIESLPAWNPEFDADLLRWELTGFELWGLAKPGRGADPEISRWLDELAATVSHHPRAICLRDFHLNNILLDSQGRVGVIDVQDIRLGPDTYDLASLLADRAMPDLLSSQQRKVVSTVWADATDAVSDWQHRILEMTLQRSLKVLGTFAFLEAKGLKQYQRWVPKTATTAAEVAIALGAPEAAVTFLLDLTATGGFDVW